MDAVLTKSESISSVYGSVFTGEQFGIIKEPVQRGLPGQRGIVHGEEVDVQVGHGEVAGGVVGEVQGGGEEDKVD